MTENKVIDEDLKKDSERILDLVGRGGKFQKLSSIFIIEFSINDYYSVISLAFQKVRPEVEYRLKRNIKDVFIPFN